MKKIGIIGGAGPLASSLLYESIVYDCYKKNMEIPEILILNFPFTRILTKDEELKNIDFVLNELRYCVETLERHNIELGILACNTLHLFLKMLPPSTIQFLALNEIVIYEAKKKKAKSLLILGSQNSCRLKLYQEPSLKMVYLPDEDQNVVDRVIDRVLKGNVMHKDALVIAQLITKTSNQMSFDGVVLGCTDLPVLHHHFKINSKFPIYDSIKITSKKIRGLV